jgi:hypothetical protein
VKPIVLAFILIMSVQLAAQTSSIATSSSNPKVRAITAFVRLDREKYQQQIAEGLVVLRKAKADFESAGYEVETIRVTTQPLAELVADIPEDQALAFLTQLDQLSARENFIPNVGPGMMHDNDDPAMMHPAGKGSVDSAKHRGQRHHRG